MSDVTITTLEGYRMEPAELRKWLREHPWTPGTNGKGMVTPTGTVVTWQAVNDDGGTPKYVHHADVMQVMGLADLDRWDSKSGAFIIWDNDEIELDYLPPKLVPHVQRYVDKAIAKATSIPA